ncbi:MAG: phosphopentomutase, partial [Oscillospiraceae bacterium]|nr:phosphopentomutase [Oscillospiraceae bacterium]
MAKRVFLIVLDSFGVGELPDAADFGDVGSNTLRSCYKTGGLNVPNMQKLGLFNIDGIDFGEKAEMPQGAFLRLSERSKGKDTTTGHWEISGLVSEKPFPTFPNGFPQEVIERFEQATGRKVICNKPYSGTAVIADYGREHIETGALIVYTSADSVFQIAAHESVVPVEQLYKYCEIA